MNKQERHIFALLIELWVKLQVPISLGVPFGPARDVWLKIKNELRITGWASNDDVQDKFEEYVRGGIELPVPKHLSPDVEVKINKQDTKFPD
jgi:hypothetical protein